MLISRLNIAFTRFVTSGKPCMRLKQLKVNGANFIFDGDSLKIFAVASFDELPKESKLTPTTNISENQGDGYIRSVCLVLNNSCN